jgi:type I restriction enzyme M protein
MLNKTKLENLTNEVWKGAIKLRGKFKAKEYPSIILPMIMIRRIECVLIKLRLEFEREILEQYPDIDKDTLAKRVKIKERQHDFHNTSDWTLGGILKEAPSQVETNFRDYISSYSSNIDEIIDKFDYRNIVGKMAKEKRLATIIQFAAEEDFSPERLSNMEMGYVYEELLQRFSQDDAKDTGEHFTPREIIRIMVELMEIDFDPATASKAISIYDPACGTGGMLSVAKEHLLNRAANEAEADNAKDLITLHGQEYLAQNYAVCKADMILKGETLSRITHGNSLIPHDISDDGDGDRHAGEQFDYMLSNPPFGVDWSPYYADVERFATSRFKVGMPPKSDGALLFLLTMLEKMKPSSGGGSKIAILFNGSPLSNGDATQGESEIRRHILENDLLDTIVMLPDQMFYSTGIYTYIWLVNNHKPKERRQQVLIINARDRHDKEPTSFGNKRNRITDTHREWIQQQFRQRQANDDCKLFHPTDFAFHKVAVVFWQEDEQGNQMWITEPFDVQLNNGNVKKRFDLYGDFTMQVTVQTMDGPATVELHVDGTEPFENLVAAALQKSVPHFKGIKAADIKKAFKRMETSATYHHRHYIEDNEYIPFDRTAIDKRAFINAFLGREIEYEIIRWEEYPQLGYEILPNKYFYRYCEPERSDSLIAQFWELEKEAEHLLTEIREL